tara:strand:- start:382 stop:789 length:408 start_codon:yes stop_codon:yes gene_type:complete
MSLETQTKKIMSAAITRFAEEEKVEADKIQLLIYTDNPDCEPKYKVLLHNKPLKDISFNEILNVKLDFLGRELIATPFIISSLKKMIRQTNCSYEEANVLIYTMDKKVEDIKLHFFVNQSEAKPMTFTDIFADIA